MNLVYIAILLIAFAFALISIYIAKILIRVSGLITTLGQTVNNVEQELDRTVIELEQFIAETEKTAVDVEEKLLATDGLFLSLGNVGDATSIVSRNLRARTEKYAKDGLLPGTKPFVRMIQYSEFATTLFTSWKRGKRVSS
ncbi:DUF948 domain-containing protein [Sporosarcina sp. G11-34]|uniref:DUF948 domain-containing protein n=1 Tax=Sporosarcina sp. G11-34 TaxID=2849605 RepID=UPI0022A9CA55|nr:DUF948 domain-containing protein [Sporosarcina sp. G11-34]MCZ2258295.1 DUF948 domain-containing protein [Sporosarcina sp. G11-34]